MPRGSSFASRSPAATFHFIRRGTRISLPRRINKSLFEFPSRGGIERKERERESEALEKLKFGSRWKRRRQLVEFTRMKFPTFRTFQLFERASFVRSLARLVRHHTASNTNRKGSIITSGAIGGTQRPRSLKSLRCPEREREGLHAVGHDSILIGIVVSDLGRSSCRPLSLSPRPSPAHPRFLVPIYPVMNIESIFI